MRVAMSLVVVDCGMPPPHAFDVDVVVDVEVEMVLRLLIFFSVEAGSEAWSASPVLCFEFVLESV
jgi:hypothetical protein